MAYTYPRGGPAPAYHYPAAPYGQSYAQAPSYSTQAPQQQYFTQQYPRQQYPTQQYATQQQYHTPAQPRTAPAPPARSVVIVRPNNNTFPADRPGPAADRYPPDPYAYSNHHAAKRLRSVSFGESQNRNSYQNGAHNGSSYEPERQSYSQQNVSSYRIEPSLKRNFAQVDTPSTFEDYSTRAAAPVAFTTSHYAASLAPSLPSVPPARSFASGCSRAALKVKKQPVKPVLPKTSIPPRSARTLPIGTTASAPGALPLQAPLPSSEEQGSCALSQYLVDLLHTFRSDFVEKRDEYNDCFEKVVASAIEAFGLEEGGDAVQVFGSVRAGLATTDSDLDLQLLTSKGYAAPPVRNHRKEMTPERKVELEQLDALHRRVRRRLRCVFIKTARVPIIKILEPTCDVSIARPENAIFGDLFRTACHFDTRVPALILLVKYWAKFRLKEVLPNLSWTLLVIHYLQTCEPPVLPPLVSPLPDLAERNPSNMAQLLWGFFEHFSVPDSFAQRLSVTQGVFRVPLLESCDPPGLQFEHPTNPDLLAFEQGPGATLQLLYEQCQHTLTTRAKCEEEGRLIEDFFSQAKDAQGRPARSRINKSNPFYCAVCNINCSDWAQHENGGRHRANVDRVASESVAGAETACELCGEAYVDKAEHESSAKHANAT